MTHVKLPPIEGGLFQLSDKEHPEHHDASGTKVFGFWLYLMTDCILFASLFATYAVLQVGVADGPQAKDIFNLSFVLVETFLLLFSSVTFGFAMIAAYSKNVNRTMLWLVVTMLFGLGFLGMELYEFNHLIHIGAGPGESAFLSAFFALVGTHGLHVTFGFAMIAAYSKNVNRTMLWLVVTMLFGLGFLGMELYEFNHLINIGAGPGESAFLSAFFALVGTHGLHVTFGVIWLVTLLVLLRKHGLTETSMTRLKCLSLFWHFLDIIWICVFSLVYLAGAA